MPRARTPAEPYRRSAEADAATSPLQAALALAVGTSDDALRALDGTPLRSRPPAVVLAALHDLALAGCAPALSAAFAADDAEAAAAAAVDVLVHTTAQVVATAGHRRVRTIEARRCAVLSPAVAEAARRTGAGAVGLVAVGCPTGFDLQLDRVGISYGDGRRLGEPSSPVRVSAEPVGSRRRSRPRRRHRDHRPPRAGARRAGRR